MHAHTHTYTQTYNVVRHAFGLMWEHHGGDATQQDGEDNLNIQGGEQTQTQATEFGGVSSRRRSAASEHDAARRSLLADALQSTAGQKVLDEDLEADQTDEMLDQVMYAYQTNEACACINMNICRLARVFSCTYTHTYIHTCMHTYMDICAVSPGIYVSSCGHAFSHTLHKRGHIPPDVMFLNTCGCICIHLCT